MKVLILSTYEKSGGAAIAAGRLIQALQRNGVEANMMVRKGKNSWSFLWERGVIWLSNMFSTKNLWAVDIANIGQDVTKTKAFQEADVIHIHWVNQGFLSFSILRKMLKSGKRVVWTMHDAWNSTGVCHLTLGCTSYQDQCGNCKYLRFKGNNDLSHIVWKKKKDLYSTKQINFVTCSQWLRNEALKSSLMSDQSVTAIPNPIDSHFFIPMDKAEARNELQLPKDKKLLLFVAQKVDNPYKGMNYLLEALKLTSQTNLALVMLGSQDSSAFGNLEGVELIPLGYVRDAQKIRKVYNAVDAFILPSLSENLPNTIMESMSCGTPCIGFNVGGIPEMIDHKENGYVANYRDAQDLAQGIDYVLASADPKALSVNARSKVEREYSEESVVKRYMEVYEGGRV